MGGRGSGGHNSKAKLRDVQCARLDVHELARDGKLTLGKCGWLFGTVWFEVTGDPDAQQVVLEFPRRSVSGERLDPVRQIICCYWRRAHYGGRYLMFLCSECGRISDRYGRQRQSHALARPKKLGRCRNRSACARWRSRCRKARFMGSFPDGSEPPSAGTGARSRTVPRLTFLKSPLPPRCLRR
jgi:hypothetical protein